MDVAFYHDDPSNRLAAAAAYDPQSSPGSVDSVSSTDAGPVCAIAAVPFERFGQDCSKQASLKVMNLQVQSGNTTYSSAQQRGFPTVSEPIVVSSESYREPTNIYEEATSSSASNNFALNIADSSVACSSTIRSPESANMLKVGGPEFDQMLTQYSQAGQQINPQVYPRSLMQEQEMYSYARELARQRTHGGSNPDIATSNQVATPPPSTIVSGSNGAPPQYESSDSYYNSRHHLPDGPSTSAFGAPASTVHYMGNPQPGHSLLMPSHHPLSQIKDELPQTVPVMSKQSISPIDMEEQEVIKTERKRMRNRLAASKCRKRKLERISRLEEKVSSLKQQNHELSSNATLLRQQVAELKSKVMSHVNSGCQMMMSQPQVTF